MTDRGAGRDTEFGRILRFTIVGVSVAALYAGLYVVFRRLEGPEWLASLAAFGLCVCVQYLAQTVFTFRAPLAAPGQLLRFLVTITLGAAIATLIPGALGPAARLPESASVAIVVVLLPIANFLMLRIWVYR